MQLLVKLLRNWVQSGSTCVAQVGAYDSTGPQDSAGRAERLLRRSHNADGHQRDNSAFSLQAKIVFALCAERDMLMLVHMHVPPYLVIAKLMLHRAAVRRLSLTELCRPRKFEAVRDFARGTSRSSCQCIVTLAATCSICQTAEGWSHQP